MSAKLQLVKPKKELKKTACAELLDKAREVARHLGDVADRPIDADDVMKALVAMGIHPSELGNAAGNLFRGSEWEPVSYRRSTRVSNKGHLIRTWRLKK